MHLMYFTEQPMSAYPAEESDRFGYTALLFPNSFFDPGQASRLYNERLAEYVLVDEVGFDGIMLNEHHNAPFCMQAKCNIFASILAATTRRVKLVLLGNPLPITDNPVRLAEELAMIDLISKGRLVSGFVRGGGVESIAANVNPAFNRARFEEAHDLIIKTWTTPGPWRWEGEHYQFRVVNPWVLPLQQPHPRVWIPGISSRETIVWAARRRYPYIALNLPIQESAERLEYLRSGGRGGGLPLGSGAARLPDSMPRGRDRGEGAAQRARVHVDAGRADRPAASGVGDSLGLPRQLGAARHWPSCGRVTAPTWAPARRSRTISNRCRSSPARPNRWSKNCASSWKRPSPRFWRYGATTAASATKTPRPASACSARKSCRRCAKSAKNSTSAAPSN